MRQWNVFLSVDEKFTPRSTITLVYRSERLILHLWTRYMVSGCPQFVYTPAAWKVKKKVNHNIILNFKHYDILGMSYHTLIFDYTDQYHAFSTLTTIETMIDYRCFLTSQSLSGYTCIKRRLVTQVFYRRTSKEPLRYFFPCFILRHLWYTLKELSFYGLTTIFFLEYWIHYLKLLTSFEQQGMRQRASFRKEAIPNGTKTRRQGYTKPRGRRMLVTTVRTVESIFTLYQ